ncbi:hypothetical protein PV350_13965 [Streptomyces sp. PA03-6a]|nr:hypothetical protein [Streptomyces sp. PA03-6a]
MGGIDWGDAPTWVGAAFAAGAAVAAFWTLASQRRQIREQQEFIAEQSATMSLERAELAALADERKWAQARQVRLTCRTAGTQPDGMGGIVGYDHWVARVENASDAPLRDVKVRFGLAYVASGAVIEEVSDLPGGGRQTAPLDVLAAHRTARFESARWPEATVDNHRPHVYFTDDAGLRWHLDERGKLEQPAEGEQE